jgi:DNA-binding response OmpR family regulator
LPDIGGLLEAAVPGAQQVQRLAAQNDKEALEEIHTERSQKDNLCRTVWQREREEMQGHVNRLQGQVLAAANDKKRSEEDRAVWQRERKEEMHRKVDTFINRLRKEVSAADKAKALLEVMHKRQEEDRAGWQREMEEMQRQVKICWEEDSAVWQREREVFEGQVNTYINRLREEVLASANAKALFAGRATRPVKSRKLWGKSRKGQGVAGGDTQEKRGG